MRVGIHSNAGFTLVEVITMAAVIGVMAGLALPSYKEAINKAYDSQLDITYGDAVQSWEVGMQEQDIKYQTGNGVDDTKTLSAGQSSEFLPGFAVVPEHMQLHGTYYRTCLTGFCTKNIFWMRHCKTETNVMRMVFGYNGEVSLQFSYKDGTGC